MPAAIEGMPIHPDAHFAEVKAGIITGAASTVCIPIDSNCRHSSVSHETERLSFGRECLRREACANIFILKVIVSPSLVSWVCCFPSNGAAGLRRSCDDVSQALPEDSSGRQRGHELPASTKWESQFAPIGSAWRQQENNKTLHSVGGTTARIRFLQNVTSRIWSRRPRC